MHAYISEILLKSLESLEKIGKILGYQELPQQPRFPQQESHQSFVVFGFFHSKSEHVKANH